MTKTSKVKKVKSTGTRLYRRKKVKTLTLWDKVARGFKRFLSPCRKK
jgi:hypothetical protein